MKKYLLILVALQIFTFNAFSKTNEEEALDMLVEDLKPYTEQLKPGLKFYHYFNPNLNDERLKSTQGRQQIAEERVQSYASYFWAQQWTDNGYMANGPGFYVAIDPLATQHYGNYAIELKVSRPGSAVLRDERLNLREKIFELINEKNFITSFRQTQGEPARRELIPMHLITSYRSIAPAFSKTAQLFKEALVRLKVVGITYSYSSRAVDFCNSIRGFLQLALTIIGNPKTSADGKTFVDTSVFEKNIYSVAAPLEGLNASEQTGKNSFDSVRSLLISSRTDVQALHEEKINSLRKSVLGCQEK